MTWYLAFVDGFDGIFDSGGAMRAFTDGSVVTSTEDGGGYIVMFEYVAVCIWCDGRRWRRWRYWEWGAAAIFAVAVYSYRDASSGSYWWLCAIAFWRSGRPQAWGEKVFVCVNVFHCHWWATSKFFLVLSPLFVGLVTANVVHLVGEMICWSFDCNGEAYELQVREATQDDTIDWQVIFVL